MAMKNWPLPLSQILDTPTQTRCANPHPLDFHLKSLTTQAGRRSKWRTPPLLQNEEIQNKLKDLQHTIDPLIIEKNPKRGSIPRPLVLQANSFLTVLLPRMRIRALATQIDPLEEKFANGHRTHNIWFPTPILNRPVSGTRPTETHYPSIVKIPSKGSNPQHLDSLSNFLSHSAIRYSVTKFGQLRKFSQQRFLIKWILDCCQIS